MVAQAPNACFVMMAKSLTQMLDDFIRITILFLIGLTLVVAVGWYLSFLYREIKDTGQVVIDKFAVIKEDGKSDDELGMGLARMLQVRLESLGPELRTAQADVSTNLSASAVASSRVAPPLGDVRLWTSTVSLQTALLQPVDMKLSVAGVEVGGVLPWIQRQLSNRRTLHFTAYMQGNTVEVAGAIDALGLPGRGLRLSIPGADNKPPSYSLVVDRIAHEIVRRTLALDPANKVQLLEPEEFVALAGVLANVAASNRRATYGRPVTTEFAAQLPAVAKLADQVQNWPELGYLAAKIADAAKEPNTALTYYHRVLPQFDVAKQTDLVTAIKGRIAVLESTTEIAAAATDAAGPAAPVAIPAQLDLSATIKRVRDGGAEGSVVGLALATVLETRILQQTKQDVQLSARHIYYLARQTGSLGLKSDSGALVEDGIKALTRVGAVEESVWPYRAGEYAKEPPTAVGAAPKFRIVAARKLSGLNEVKRGLVADGPVIAGISVFQSMMATLTAKTGNVPMPAEKSTIVGGHAIVIVGFDDMAKRVKFVNSWGSGWGEGGFGYLSYAYLEKYMSDAWTFRYAQPMSAAPN
jgi:hypothetical protein